LSVIQIGAVMVPREHLKVELALENVTDVPLNPMRRMVLVPLLVMPVGWSA
jgi:hypothetical protein